MCLVHSSWDLGITIPQCARVVLDPRPTQSLLLQSTGHHRQEAGLLSYRSCLEPQRTPTYHYPGSGYHGSLLSKPPSKIYSKRKSSELHFQRIWENKTERKKTLILSPTKKGCTKAPDEASHLCCEDVTRTWQSGKLHNSVCVVVVQISSVSPQKLIC